MIKTYCDGAGCGKEILNGTRLTIPPGHLLEDRAVRVTLELIDPHGYIDGKRAGDFCGDCLVRAINEVVDS